MNTGTLPKVSVIMGTYNENPEIVTEAIESILKQSYENFELLIMDDSKSEETVSCLNELSKKDARIKIIRKSERMGLSGARNAGLKEAKGKYIAIMDGDDYSLPERFSLQVKYLEENPDVYVLGGQIKMMDSDSNIISERHYPIKGFKLKLFAAYRNPLAHPAVMFRADLIKKGFYYDEALEMSEDLDLWLRILNEGYEIQNLPEFIINYRLGDNFTKKRTSDKQIKYMAMVRKKNFNIKRPIFSLASLTAGFIFKAVPKSTIQGMYKKENKE